MSLDKSARSICFIIVYLGAFPAYLRVFLEGCKRNSDIDWIIFHDHDPHITPPANVRFVPLDHTALINRIKEKTGFDAKISHPYKLVDCKPLYGHLFEEYLTGYAFWGITDLDVIYGSVRRFITDGILRQYDIITAYETFLAGHFTLFRNTPFITRLYLNNPMSKRVIESPDRFVSVYDERSFDLLVRKEEQKGLLRVYRKDLVLACTDERWYFEWYKNTVTTHQQYYPEPDEVHQPLVDKTVRERDYGPADIRDGGVFHHKTGREYLYMHLKEWKENLSLHAIPGIDYAQCHIDDKGIYALTGNKSIDRILPRIYRIAAGMNVQGKRGRRNALTMRGTPIRRRKKAIVTFADRKYIEQAKQVYTSIATHAGWDGDYILLTPGIPAYAATWFEKRGVIVKQCYEFMTTEEKEKTDTEARLDPVAFMKCCLFSPWFTQWKHIIYVDADTIVNGPLDELARVKGLYAVRDYVVDYATPLRYQFMSRRNKTEHQKHKLIAELEQRMDFDQPAFNSGVMAFSTDIIRPDTFATLIALARKYLEVALYHDQGILNIYFYDQWKELPIPYNFNPHAISEYTDLTQEKIDKINVIIYHFPTPMDKPWNPGHPYYQLWTDHYNNRESLGSFTARPLRKPRVNHAMIAAGDRALRAALRSHYHILEGIFEEENDHGTAFRWMTRRARVILPETAGSSIIFKLFSPFPDYEQMLTITSPDTEVHHLKLRSGWHTYAVPRERGNTCTLEAMQTLSEDIDDRILAVRIASITTSDTVPEGSISETGDSRGRMITHTREIQSRLDPLRSDGIFPIIDVEVTLKCNQSCMNCIKFCNKQDMTGIDYSASALTEKQIQKFIDDVKRVYQRTGKKVAGIIYLTGGEPLLHPKIVEFFFMIKKELCDTGICNGVFINSNLTVPIPAVLEPFIVNFVPISEKSQAHQAVFAHPLDYGQKAPTYQTCTHYRKWTVVYHYGGYNVCCAADGYIRLFNRTALFCDTLPDNFAGFPLDKMDEVCQHCAFGCPEPVLERNHGMPVSDIYLRAGIENKKRHHDEINTKTQQRSNRNRLE